MQYQNSSEQYETLKYLLFFRNSITEEGMELQVSVLEAKGLVLPFKVDSIDTFVRIYLVPDQAGALQTKVSAYTV